MLRFITAACAIIALSACSGSEDVDADGDGKVSADEAKVAAAKVRPLQPGEYKMNMEIVELNDPTMSAEEVDQAKKFFTSMSSMAPPRCLSEEEAKEGMMGVAETIQNGDCTIDTMTSDQDGMHGEMTCKADSGNAKVTMDTTSTGTASEMTMNVVEPTADGKEKRVTMKVGMTRLGDCKQQQGG